MAATHVVRVDLPSDLYNQMKDAAARSDQSVEAVLVGSLALLFGDPLGDIEQLTAIMSALPDEGLWAVVRRRVPWTSSAQVRALAAKGRHMPLSGAEQAELETLIHEADQFTLLRSRALLQLKQRGHNIDAYLSPNP
jgi:hypothetical protein